MSERRKIGNFELEADPPTFFCDLLLEWSRLGYSGTVGARHQNAFSRKEQKQVTKTYAVLLLRGEDIKDPGVYIDRASWQKLAIVTNEYMARFATPETVIPPSEFFNKSTDK